MFKKAKRLQTPPPYFFGILSGLGAKYIYTFAYQRERAKVGQDVKVN